MGNGNEEQELKHNFNWKSFSTISKYYSKHALGNFYLKAPLHSLIPFFIDWVTQCVR